MSTKDLSSRLPNGDFFPLWEDETAYANFLYVDCSDKNASDSNPGTKELPLKTINAAAQLAEPKTKVIIKSGTYRETVSPTKGGNDNKSMICYEADGEVIVKASVIAKKIKPSVGWRLTSRWGMPKPEGINVWEISLDPEDFKGYNPFCAVNIIHDRLFIEFAKTDMTTYLNRRGMVFVDGKPLKQVPLYNMLALEPGSYWVESNGQKVHVRFPDNGTPDGKLIELTNREQCFAPNESFLSYIRVKGLTLAHAANGAPVPQRGSLSVYRGHHWIIEDCLIDWANTVGIDCGNECWHHEWIDDQVLGYHIIRRNTINDVGVCGIAALRSTNMLIEDNLISGTGWQRMELSWEAAGIKTHHAKNMLIRRNIIRRCIGCDSIWLDVDNNNCRITGNLLIDGIDSREHIFMEMNRDAEDMIDNNIIWNVEGRYDKNALPDEPGSSGWYKNSQLEVKNGYGIYIEGNDRLRVSNNLIGKCDNAGFHGKIVAFRIGSKRGGTSRESKFFNNIFYDCGEAAIKMPSQYNLSEGNAFSKMPGGFLRVLTPEPSMCLDLDTWQEFLGFDLTGCMANIQNIEIDSETFEMVLELGEDLPEVQADEKIEVDYFANYDSSKKRIAGPFTGLKVGKNVLNVDPRKHKK